MRESVRNRVEAPIKWVVRRGAGPLLAMSLVATGCNGITSHAQIRIEGTQIPAAATSTPGSAAGTPKPPEPTPMAIKVQIDVGVKVNGGTERPESTVIQGPKGDTGEKGEKGNTGFTGAAGRDGKDGRQGEPGKDGVGTQGPAGPRGIQGERGIQGLPGSTSTIPEETVTSETFCPDATVLGPWAPDADGKSEEFEVGSMEPGKIVVVNVFIPGVTPPNTEYRFILDNTAEGGRRFQVIGAGIAFQFKKGCNMEEVIRQTREHETRRGQSGIQTVVTTAEGFDELYPDNITRLPGDRTLR